MKSSVSETVVEMPEELEDIEELEELEELEDTINYLEKGESRVENFLVPAAAITLALSVIITLAVFFGVAMRKNAPKSRFVRWWREFLNFRKIWIAGILKFVYIFLSTLLTIGSIAIMFYGGTEPWIFVLLGLAGIIFGNLSLRIGFEMTMIMIGLWENTADIRGAVVKEEKKEVE